jgi:serine-type D-Ala-D-Ala carboxypeptidase/endopeptidase (penicillin-binding protein 4)
MRIFSFLAISAAVALFAACSPSIMSPPVQDIRPVTVPSYSKYHSLKKQIDDIVQSRLLPYTNAGIKVYSLQKRETLYEFNPRLLLTPASNQKLFTAATALETLGKERAIATTVYLNPATETIYLKGCGDSLLSEADLAGLAKAASAHLDHNTNYKIAADLSCFDDLYWGKGWMWDDEPDSDEMYITPLAINLNTITVTLSPGKADGLPAIIETSPKTPLVKVDNRAITGSSGDADSIKVDRRPGDRDNAITVSGVIPAGGEQSEKHISIWKPERIALAVFTDYLRAEGFSVTDAGVATTPAGSQRLSVKKRPVSDLVHFALKQSDNLSAESLMKLLGLDMTHQPGSAEAGAAAIRSFLEKEGIATDNLVIADGSGVSRYNLTNADTIVRLLDAVYRDDKIYGTFYDSLPIAGKDGTLAKRMKGTPAEGNVRAKTGNMEGVSSLSGYGHSADGELLAFSIIIENFIGKAQPILDVQDSIATLLSGFHR